MSEEWKSIFVNAVNSIYENCKTVGFDQSNDKIKAGIQVVEGLGGKLQEMMQDPQFSQATPTFTSDGTTSKYLFDEGKFLSQSKTNRDLIVAGHLMKIISSYAMNALESDQYKRDLEMYERLVELNK